MTKHFIVPFIVTILLSFISCKQAVDDKPWEKHGNLQVTENSHFIEHEDGTPFLWIGGTSWGMPEWLNREDVDYYLDDRNAKGMNVIQICALWGKRHDNPVSFQANQPNAYGHRALEYTDSIPDPSKPATKAGGSPSEPNDFWDHLDYIFQAAEKRGMYIALLPVWGRRYVNGTHGNFSTKLFTVENAFEYGIFLGERYAATPNIIWVLGGDVQPTSGGDHRKIYRAMAEGITRGISGEKVSWESEHQHWDKAIMTYHPDGNPYLNSSEWFHTDPWLDFNMIETHIHRDDLYKAVLHDYSLVNPVKPTVMGEPHYEGYSKDTYCSPLNVRRQAYQTFFAGGTGFTYGGYFDSLNHGPLFSPFNEWKELLDMEGVTSLPVLKAFLLDQQWQEWVPDTSIVTDDIGHGENRKVAVKNNTEGEFLVYFPDTTVATIKIPGLRVSAQEIMWFNTKNGETTDTTVLVNTGEFRLKVPENFEDGVAIIHTKK